MLLTIAIPTYNRKRYLDELLESFGEHLPPIDEWEVLISDNASSYDINEVVLRHRNRLPLNVYRNVANCGGTQNFYHCVSRARGEFVWLLGDDELLLPGAVGRVLSILKEDPALGLVLLSGRNWGSGHLSQKRFDSYGTYLREVSGEACRAALEQTLISAVVFRKSDFDFRLAYQCFDTNYGQAYGMFWHAGNRPVVVLSNGEPVFWVRDERAPFDEAPPRLERTQVRYLRDLSFRFKARALARWARVYRGRVQRNAVRDWFFRTAKRCAPKLYGDLKSRWGRRPSARD